MAYLGKFLCVLENNVLLGIVFSIFGQVTNFIYLKNSSILLPYLITLSFAIDNLLQLLSILFFILCIIAYIPKDISISSQQRKLSCH